MTQQHHPTAERLEAYVEGLLDQAERVVVESHLVGCAGCRQEVDEWLALFAALSDLPELEPSPDFADRIMARVRIAPRAQWARYATRLADAVSRLLPKTTLGWALSAGFLAVPMVLGAVAIWWLLNNPWAGPGALWSFATMEAAEGLRVLGSTVATALLQTDVAAWLVTRGGALLAAAGPAGVGAVAAATGMMMTLSIWVLYRNLIRTPSRDSRYALFSF